MLMPKQIAIDFGTFEDSSITLGGILNPGLSLVVILFITGKCFFARNVNQPEESQALETEI
jgi:hypothetical protein